MVEIAVYSGGPSRASKPGLCGSSVVSGFAMDSMAIDVWRRLTNSWL